MAEAFLHILLEKLNLLILNEFGLLSGIDKELKRLSSCLSTIRAVIQDAEEKQVRDKDIQHWLTNLNYAAYDMDDILDECATKASLSKFQSHNSTLVNKVQNSIFSSFKPGDILFRHRIGTRLKEIRKRIDEIAEERSKFHLHEASVSVRRVEVTETRQTGSVVTQPCVYGREEDKEKVVKCLVNCATDCYDVSVYPVVGMGGLGKTRLAQLVFNHERVCRHFELRIWVYVSRNFDVKRVMKDIIESASGTSCEVLQLDHLQRRLQDMLKEKRYLLVLDDVWNENQETWDQLKCVLACGAKGASVLVTTRLQKAAYIMGTLPVHHLSGLSREDCWLLFKQRAFGHETEERSNLVAIGKDIVSKCGGVPLAAKTLGSLMRFKMEENEWVHVKESELWNLPQEENSILPALRLSYSNLPLELKQCFAYCAIFPKGSDINKEEVILLWMANGFISPRGRLEPEDVGNEICNELCSRSFCEDVKRDGFSNITSFKMHDLVHDLAQSIVADEYCVLGNGRPSSKLCRIRHVNLMTPSDDPQLSREFQSARTVLQAPAMFAVSGFSKSSWRALTVRRGLSKLPSSIGNLKHLRYLKLSMNYAMRVLPESICSLWNLQTLKLEYWVSLEKLPKRMSHLRNLRHLYLDHCISLQETPPNMGEITCLKTLSLFIVGEKRGHRLSELQQLNLGGVLEIKHLERVQSLEDAKAANLVHKQNLRRLTLAWGFDAEPGTQESMEEVFEALEPHPNLQELVIKGYKSSNFPHWMKDPILQNIVCISLEDCTNCVQLPPLWNLPSLKDLRVYDMKYLEFIMDDSTITRGFACLETLKMFGLPSLRGLSKSEEREAFPCLTKLDIFSCPNLTLPSLPSLKQVTLCETKTLLLSSISKQINLTRLDITENDDIVSFPGMLLQNLTALRTMHVSSFTNLQEWTKDPISLNNLESLEIFNCPELQSCSEQGFQGMNALGRLSIAGCKKLMSLSDGLQDLTALVSLSIQDCPELVAFPDSVKYLCSLQHLYISGRPVNVNTQSTAKLVALPDGLQCIPALQSLSVSGYPLLSALPEWLGGLTSLQSLSINECSKLTFLPTSIQSLSNLQKLSISNCPELENRCKKEREEWPKIAHVPKVMHV